jgi:molybdopterin-guanine dinucleotide biosynthesis protein B
MLPIICIVGASNSGKTTFLEKLIPELRGRGYRIGTVKHDAHGFEMDREGKDTWRHRRAGASTIAISSPVQVATIRQTDSELTLDELAGRFFWTEDLLITEGYKRSRFPKIEIFRTAIEAAPICSPSDNLMAVVTDDPVAVEVPTFGFAEVARLADLIEDRFLKGRKKHRILVQLDSKRLPMNDFVRDIVVGAIQGMLSNLRGWEAPKKIDIQIRLEDE